MKPIPDNVLIRCMDLIEAGSSIADILVQFPDHAEQLRPFLQVASQLNTIAVSPTLSAKQASQKAFLQEAARRSASTAQTPKSHPAWRRIAMPIALFALVLFLISATLLPFSGSALPGDVLYGTKRGVETWRLNRAADNTEVEGLQTQFKQERIREVLALLRTDRTVLVSFRGKIEQFATSTWQISGVLVQVNAQTIINGSPAEGAEALVVGLVESGKLMAEVILIDRPEKTAPTPEIDPTEVPDATATAVSTTPTSTATPTQTATADNQTTTPTPSSTPTMTSTPDEDDNENDATVTVTPSPNPVDDSSNDNEDDNESSPPPPPADDNENENNENNSNDNEDEDDNSSNNNGDDENENNDDGNENQDDNDNDNDNNDNDDNDNDDDDNDNDDNDKNDNDDEDEDEDEEDNNNDNEDK